MSEEQRQSSKLLEPRIFDAYKNTTAPMIAMLGHLEINTKVLNAGIEIKDSNNCREISRNNRDANGVLSMMQEEARLAWK